MSDRCKELDDKIAELERRYESANESLRPAIDLLIAAYRSRRENVQCRDL
jgi:hypothetical protein